MLESTKGTRIHVEKKKEDIDADMGRTPHYVKGKNKKIAQVSYFLSPLMKNPNKNKSYISLYNYCSCWV